MPITPATPNPSTFEADRSPRIEQRKIVSHTEPFSQQPVLDWNGKPSSLLLAQNTTATTQSTGELKESASSTRKRFVSGEPVHDWRGVLHDKLAKHLSYVADGESTVDYLSVIPAFYAPGSRTLLLESTRKQWFEVHRKEGVEFWSEVGRRLHYLRLLEVDKYYHSKLIIRETGKNYLPKQSEVSNNPDLAADEANFLKAPSRAASASVTDVSVRAFDFVQQLEYYSLYSLARMFEELEFDPSCDFTVSESGFGYNMSVEGSPRIPGARASRLPRELRGMAPEWYQLHVAQKVAIYFAMKYNHAKTAINIIWAATSIYGDGKNAEHDHKIIESVQKLNPRVERIDIVAAKSALRANHIMSLFVGYDHLRDYNDERFPGVQPAMKVDALRKAYVEGQYFLMPHEASGAYPWPKRSGIPREVPFIR